MTQLSFTFNVIVLQYNDIKELYNRFPEIGEPYYPKEVIESFSGKNGVLEYVWLKMTIDNKHYLCQSFPAANDIWYLLDTVREPDETFICPVCGEVRLINESCAGCCSECECKGIWIDPAGGIHHESSDDDDFSDPAAMYE